MDRSTISKTACSSAKDRGELNYYCVYIKQNPQMTVQVAAITIIKVSFIQGVFLSLVQFQFPFRGFIFSCDMDAWPSMFRCFVRLNSRGDLYLERKFQEDCC